MGEKMNEHRQGYILVAVEESAVETRISSETFEFNAVEAIPEHEHP